MAAGTSNHFLGLAGTGVISGVALLLHWTNYGSFYKSEFMLSLPATRSEGEETPAYSQAIRKFAKTCSLLHTEASGDGKMTKLSFDITIKRDLSPDDLIREVASVSGVSEVRLVVSRNDVDY